MRLRGGLIAIICAVATHAAAQDFDPKIDIQLMQPSAGPKSYVVTANGSTAPKGQLSVDFMVTFLANPFTIFNLDQMGNVLDERTEVVKTMLSAELGAAYGITDRIQLGIIVPGVLSMTGDGVDANTGMPSAGGLSIRGLGDIRLEGKFAIVNRPNFGFSALATIGIPSSIGSEDGDFLGDNLPSGHIRAAAQYIGNRISFGVNAGVLLRKPRDLFESEMGQQLTYSAGASFHAHNRVSLIADIFGRSDFGFNVDSAPLEGVAAVRIHPSSSLYVTAGGGMGIVRGVGAPRWRAFANVGYVPDTRDPDGDGIPNQRDRCPNTKEDFDNFEDGDGCPEKDNDGDKRLDAEDKCPNEAEDMDGFEDDDGCPEDDNDKDGIVDMKDQCPMIPEDGFGKYPKDGCPKEQTDSDNDEIADFQDKCPNDPEDADEFEDWDGCPEPDNDKDGIVDADDECPLCPEDTDGHRDGDGCPDPDNDGDGLADNIDKCPNQAETINGINDGDGCPDSGGAQLVAFNGRKIVFRRNPTFERNGSLKRAGRVLVDQAAAVMRSNPKVTKWAIVIVAKDNRRTNAISRTVVERLKSQGVALTRLEMVRSTGGSQFAIVAKETSELEADAPEVVCTKERQVKPKAQPISTVIDPVDTVAKKPDKPDPKHKTDIKEPPKLTPGSEQLVAFELYQGVIKSIEFRRNRSRLRKGKKVVKRLAKLMKENKQVVVEINAYTDSRKSAEKSKKITQDQADELAKLLVRYGVDKKRIKAIGRGLENPIGDNKRSAGRRQNRRIELRFFVGTW